jgi:hypothetical protein
MADDPKWPAYPIGPRDSILALGVASINFVALETSLHFLFGTVFELGVDDQVLIPAKIGAEATMFLMRERLRRSDLSPTAKDHLEHFLKGFESCLENRNHLMHSQMVSAGSGIVRTEKTLLFKTTKKGALHGATPSLTELRQIADATHNFANYGRNLGNWINVNLSGKPTFSADAFPLPDKPALPQSLNYSPDPRPL